MSGLDRGKVVLHDLSPTTLGLDVFFTMPPRSIMLVGA